LFIAFALLPSDPSGTNKLAADLVLWTAGNAPSTKEQRKGFPFPTDDRGSVLTVRLHNFLGRSVYNVFSRNVKMEQLN
jgi:uracil-DNA glycosylase